MGKKERERKQASKRAMAYGTSRARVTVTSVTEQDIERVFLLKDCVHLTTEVIQSLVEQGWDEKQLHECEKDGGHYCEPRHSIIFPEPEGMEMEWDGKGFLIHYHTLRTSPRPAGL